ncbi:MAG: HAMP domain-containing histidine kinase, partial [Candidatus Cloacimonetes bacterium]|nr:HAMP domain-containing histidine kinase [Candidatus Cloacimonadota bacterium]
TISYDKLNLNQKEYLNQLITEMKKRGHLFFSRIKLYPDRLVKIKTYYEDLSVVKRMRLIPVLQILGLLMLMTGGIYLFFIISQNEKDNLWIGMAKETAHQFGTPVTALMGWIELLKLRTGEQYQDILSNMEIDLTLLQKTANRFNKISSKLSFKPHDITELINESVRYFRLRLPHFNSKINILFINQSDNLYLNIDADLFKWSLENLIKNSIDAMKNKAGNIFIQLSYSKKKIHIIVMDEGCGIPKNISWKQIFEPGVTSKNRGWGLGLSLTKRIVEDYFKGSIKVLRSVPNDGCVIEICLPENLICKESKTS